MFWSTGASPVYQKPLLRSDRYDHPASPRYHIVFPEEGVDRYALRPGHNEQWMIPSQYAPFGPVCWRPTYVVPFGSVFRAIDQNHPRSLLFLLQGYNPVGMIWPVSENADTRSDTVFLSEHWSALWREQAEASSLQLNVYPDWGWRCKKCFLSVKTFDNTMIQSTAAIKDIS